MSAESERRWDDALEQAWRGFRQRLADRLAALGEGEVHVLRVEGEAGAPDPAPCRVASADSVLRVEVSSLAPTRDLDRAQRDRLEAIGFAEPTPGSCHDTPANHWVELDQRKADRAAVMVVRALREVLAVVHPAYVGADGLASAEQEGPEVRLPEPQPEPDQPVFPQGPDDVRRAIDLAVEGVFSQGTEWDEDGDLVVPTERGVVWVTVGDVSPRVLVHAPLVDEVVDDGRALVEVNLLNQREFGLTFALQDGRVRVMRELDVTVLVPLRLRLEIERLVESVDRWAADLATRAGGRCVHEQSVRPPADAGGDRPTESRFATAYAVMAELEREQRGSVTPATMARIFDNDTGLLLKAVRLNEQRRRDMRRKAREARQQGHLRTEQVASARQDYLRELTSRMRAALRLLVDAPVRKVHLDQLALFDEDDCGTGR